MKILTSIAFVFVLSCASLPKKYKTEKETCAVVSDSTGKIVFLNYRAFRNSEETIQVKLISKIIVDGNLKNSGNKEKNIVTGNLLCLQLDEDDLPMDSILISNPLSFDVEYVESSGKLGRKLIELDSADFSVRMQLAPESKFIVVETATTPKEELLKISL